MDKILDRICCIKNHPVAKLDEKYRMIYAKGLIACMYSISGGDNTSKMLTLAWVNSICPHIISIDNIWKANNDFVKKAISVQRKGFKFFSMKNSFFFDVLYLAESSRQYGSELDNVKSYFRDEICGYFSKKAFNTILSGYMTPSILIPGVDPVLLNHRKNNIDHLASKEKKVLVVANVSAGKSTLINALIGYRLNRTLTTACTNKLVFLHNKTIKDGMMIQDTKNKYYYSSLCNQENLSSENFIHASFHFNSLLSSIPIYLIDTPGINNAVDTRHREITVNAVLANDYNCIIYISNCQYNATTDESNLLYFLQANSKKPIIFVLNQLDKMKQKEDSIQGMINDYWKDLVKKGFKYPIIVPVSAQAALLFKLSTELDEDDLLEKEQLEKRFNNKFYDLPSYMNSRESSSLLEKTGILYLEQTIIKILKNT